MQQLYEEIHSDLEEKIVGSGSRGVKLVEAVEAMVVRETNEINERKRRGGIRSMNLEE